MHVESVDALDDGSTTPLIDARLLRIEIVDEAGQLIARANPVMSLEEADRKRAEKEAICALQGVVRRFSRLDSGDTETYKRLIGHGLLVDGGEDPRFWCR